MSSAAFKEDRKQIWNILLSIDKALVQKDAAAFEQLLYADFVGAIPTGASFAKEAYINHHCNGSFGVVALAEENMEDASIRLYDNTVVVNRRAHAHFKLPSGNVVEYDVQRIEVLVKIDNEWKMVSGQGTQVIPLPLP